MCQSEIVDTDVVVVGGGPAGSTAATILAQQGWRVTLLEKERFPRFQVGESLLPYNNDLFRRLDVIDDLRTGRFIDKRGAEFVTADGSMRQKFLFRDTL
ncbi:MAG: FAD-dependent oxidoreductase, partial [Thermoanaerobaculia bacterium]|nr:FAD-dependent oxidoreductase [Thermoanaerobaculia bacterium]